MANFELDAKAIRTTTKQEVVNRTGVVLATRSQIDTSTYSKWKISELGECSAENIQALAILMARAEQIGRA